MILFVKQYCIQLSGVGNFCKLLWIFLILSWRKNYDFLVSWETNVKINKQIKMKHFFYMVYILWMFPAVYISYCYAQKFSTVEKDEFILHLNKLIKKIAVLWINIEEMELKVIVFPSWHFFFKRQCHKIRCWIMRSIIDNITGLWRKKEKSGFFCHHHHPHSLYPLQ